MLILFYILDDAFISLDMISSLYKDINSLSKAFRRLFLIQKFIKKIYDKIKQQTETNIKWYKMCCENNKIIYKGCR